MKKVAAFVLQNLVLIGALISAINIPQAMSELSIIIIPDDYPTIQEAINNANEGDTIFVRAGTYYEHVTIDRSVSLIGEEKYTAIIDGEGTGSVICTTADNVTIARFTVRNSGRTISSTNPDAGISASHVNNCNISGNILTDNYVGIFVRPSKSAWLTNNFINRNHIGVDINNQSTYNILSGNSLKENNVSIHVYYADFNVFFENIITDSLVGVVVRHSSNNTFSENEIRNGRNGIIFDGADFNNVRENIASNLEYGIQLKTYAEHNFISENSITNCSYAGIDLDEHACNNSLSRNIIANSEVGIDVSNWSANNTISRNHLVANLVSVHFWYANLNRIFKNNITGNNVGVVILYSESNKLYHNTFLDNTQQVSISTDYTNFWDNGHSSGGNYWSDHVCIGNPSDGSQPYVINANNTDRYPFQDPNGWVIQGDINEDETVNILDALLLANVFGSVVGDSNWNPDADMNSDKVVNILDLIILASHFGKSGA